MSQELVQQLQPLHRLRFLQDLLPVLRAEPQGLGQVIRHIAGAVLPGDAPQEIRVVLRQKLRQVGHQAPGAPDEGLPVPGSLPALELGKLPDLRPVMGEALQELFQLRPVQALDQDPHAPAGDAQDLPDFRHGAHPEQVCLLRHFRLRVGLAGEEYAPVPLHGGVHGGNGEGPLQIKIQHQLREHLEAPERNHRKIFQFIAHGFPSFGKMETNECLRLKTEK